MAGGVASTISALGRAVGREGLWRGLRVERWELGGSRTLAKGRGKGGKGKKAGKGAVAAGDSPEGGASGEARGPDWAGLEERLGGARQSLARDLAEIRSGRATPGLLDHLHVLAYGERTPLKGVASVAVRGPRTLGVMVYDPANLKPVMKAIAASGLALNPQEDGDEIVVPVPEPTQEARAAMAKVAAQAAEKARVRVRAERQKVMGAVKALASKDEQKLLEKRAEKVVEGTLQEIGALVQAKERELKEM